MTHKLFKKEYFDAYDFYSSSEREFRKHPTVNKITTGFLYEGGLIPVWVLISAFQSEEEALSTLDEKSLIDVLEDLKQEVIDANFIEGHMFVYILERKIREIKMRNRGGGID